MIESIRPILTARLTQLFVRWFAAFLVGMAGWDAAKSDSLAAGAAEATVAVAMFYADMAIRNARKRAGEAK
jgi:hypothetical protein